MSSPFIYVARHAWAYHFGDPRWPDDAERELEPEGAERFMQVVQTLAERGFAPQAIATSPYVRCRQTADIIARYTEHRPEVVETEALAPGSDFEALCHWSQQTGCEKVCWVGHAPDVGNLAAVLVGDQGAHIRFAKGAIAAVRFDSDFEDSTGELYWLATAKSLGL